MGQCVSSCFWGKEEREGLSERFIVVSPPDYERPKTPPRTKLHKDHNMKPSSVSEGVCQGVDDALMPH